MTPFISILIPCFNAEKWIGQAIESALGQTWPKKEVIVVDDGSSDGSLEIIKGFGSSIHWETGPNCGGNAARNRLLKMAKGEWVQYLDADDYLLPDKIAQQVSAVQADPNVDVVFSRVIQETHTASGIDQGVSLMPEPLDPWILLVRWDLPQTGAVLWRKQCILSVGGWKIDQPCCQEHELYLRLLISGKRFIYCAQYGAVYRQWSSGSVCTRDPRRVHQNRLKIIRKAEEILRERNELTPPRLWAINQACFEVARFAWQYDREFATRIIGDIHHSQPKFVPGGKVANAHYRIIYRTFGFRVAERLAAFKRWWTGRSYIRSASAAS